MTYSREYLINHFQNTFEPNLEFLYWLLYLKNYQ